MRRQFIFEFVKNKKWTSGTSGVTVPPPSLPYLCPRCAQPGLVRRPACPTLRHVDDGHVQRRQSSDGIKRVGSSVAWLHAGPRRGTQGRGGEVLLWTVAAKPRPARTPSRVVFVSAGRGGIVVNARRIRRRQHLSPDHLI